MAEVIIGKICANPRPIPIGEVLSTLTNAYPEIKNGDVDAAFGFRSGGKAIPNTTLFTLSYDDTDVVAEEFVYKVKKEVCNVRFVDNHGNRIYI